MRGTVATQSGEAGKRGNQREGGERSGRKNCRENVRRSPRRAGADRSSRKRAWRSVGTANCRRRCLRRWEGSFWPKRTNSSVRGERRTCEVAGNWPPQRSLETSSVECGPSMRTRATPCGAPRASAGNNNATRMVNLGRWGFLIVLIVAGKRTTRRKISVREGPPCAQGGRVAALGSFQTAESDRNRARFGPSPFV